MAEEPPISPFLKLGQLLECNSNFFGLKTVEIGDIQKSFEHGSGKPPLGGPA